MSDGWELLQSKTNLGVQVQGVLYCKYQNYDAKQWRLGTPSICLGGYFRKARQSTYLSRWVSEGIHFPDPMVACGPSTLTTSPQGPPQGAADVGFAEHEHEHGSVMTNFPNASEFRLGHSKQ